LIIIIREPIGWIANNARSQFPNVRLVWVEFSIPGKGVFSLKRERSGKMKILIAQRLLQGLQIREIKKDQEFPGVPGL